MLKEKLLAKKTRFMDLVREDWADFKAVFPYVGERASMVLALSFGFWMHLQWSRYAGVFTLAPYRILSKFVQQATFSNVLLGIGAVHLFAIIISLIPILKYNKAGLLLREVCLGIECVIWASQAVTTLISFPPSLGFVAYFWFFICSRSAFLWLTPRRGS
jgi:hypothetical protein